MSPNPGRRDRAEPPATPTRDGVPEEGRNVRGHRVTGRLGAILLAVSLLGACGANTTPSPATTPAPTPSPAATADEALLADLAALMSNPYDAAKVAALYAPNAVMRELTEANVTSTGLEQIGARIRYFNTQDFKVVVTSAPTRQDNFVAHFVRFGAGEATYPGLVVYELKDGKVLNQWVYPAP
jgi:hypothetical protein